MRPFRFGLQVSTSMDVGRFRDVARRAEALGFSTLTVPDHFDDSMAWVPAVMAAADATSTLRVGPLVACNDYRLPIVLAKEAATIDLLSGGRLDLGVGAGWMVSDYRAAGIPLDPPGPRIERLARTLDVLDAAWGGTRPTLVIGGGGRRMLTLAAKRADVVGLNISLTSGAIDSTSGRDATVEATDRKVAWVRAAAGDRFDHLELQVRVHLAVVTDDRDSVAAGIAPAFGLTPEEALASPHALAGTVDQICDDLLARRERWGISYIGVSLDAMDSLAPVVERLAGP
ncbi:MAG: TIGR03621 family F420-dependent LLM class oxidoreductase [Acidimicrobiales bacterium]